MRTTIALSAIAAVALAQSGYFVAEQSDVSPVSLGDCDQYEMIEKAVCIAMQEAEAADIAINEITDGAMDAIEASSSSTAIDAALAVTDSASAVADAFGTIIENVATSIEDGVISNDSQNAIKNAVADATEAIDFARDSVEDVRDSNRDYNSYYYSDYNYESSYYNYNYGDSVYTSDEQDAQAALEAAVAAADASFYNSYSYENLMLAKTSLANNDAEFYSSVNAVQTGANVVAIVVSLLVSLCCLSIIICCLCFYCAAAKTAVAMGEMGQQLNQPLIDQEGQDKQQEPATL